MGNALHGLLGEKVYHSIGHLPGSKVGAGDHTLDPNTAQKFTDIACWKGPSERIVIQEKLDGSCVSVICDGDTVFAAQRNGHLCSSSPYEQHHRFAEYVEANASLFMCLLGTGQRLVGEWMAQAHGIRYDRLTAMFYAFDIRHEGEWLPALEVKELCDHWGVETVPLLYFGPPLAVEHVGRLTNRSAFRSKGHAEGVVLRREFGGRRVDIAKYVRQDHKAGIYLPDTDDAMVTEPVWHELVWG